MNGNDSTGFHPASPYVLEPANFNPLQPAADRDTTLLPPMVPVGSVNPPISATAGTMATPTWNPIDRLDLHPEGTPLGSPIALPSPHGRDTTLLPPGALDEELAGPLRRDPARGPIDYREAQADQDRASDLIGIKRAQQRDTPLGPNRSADAYERVYGPQRTPSGGVLGTVMAAPIAGGMVQDGPPGSQPSEGAPLSGSDAFPYFALAAAVAVAFMLTGGFKR